MPVQTLHITNKIVVITGGGSGIGLSFTKLAIQNGARVLIADLRLTPEAADYVEKKKASGKVAFVKCDVSKRADLENLAPASQRAFNDTPDVWVASAGVFEPVRHMNTSPCFLENH
jgi:NAD(P)-dependent dehydrogenase (short-subunit alcohol dehydrogenase family)